MWNIKYLNQLLEVSLPHQPNVCIYGLHGESVQPWIWFSYIDYVLFISTASEGGIDEFLESDWTICILIWNFHMRVLHRKSIFLMLLLELNKENRSSISTAILQMAISTFTLSHATLVTQNLQLFLVRLWDWKEFVIREVVLLLM